MHKLLIFTIITFSYNFSAIYSANSRSFSTSDLLGENNDQNDILNNNLDNDENLLQSDPLKQPSIQGPPAWFQNLTKKCWPTAKRLADNQGSVVDIATNGDEEDWECVAKTIYANPDSPSGAIKHTAPCINRSSEWNTREDSVNLLTLKTDPKMQKLLAWMTRLIFIILQMTMLALGCEILIDEVKKHAAKPVGAIIAVTAQFGVMPLAAFALGRLLKMDFYPSIALIICGCCPGGNLSNLLAYGVRGDMNLSILMTTCSSIGGLALMPVMIALYGGWTKAIFAADPASSGVALTGFGWKEKYISEIRPYI